MLGIQKLRLKSSITSLLLIIFLFLLANIEPNQVATLRATASELENVNDNFSTTDTLDTYYGTIKFEMKDGSFITPFGVDVILRDGESVVKSVSTNNNGRYYLKNMDYGRYEMTVQHRSSTVFTDSLIINQSTSKNLGEVVIDINS